MACHGNSPFHCCWIEGQQCPHLEEHTVPGRRWACGLYRQSGSWPAVYDSAAYQGGVKPRLDAVGLPDCGDWPQNDPAAMASPSGKCCWQEVTGGNVG